MANYDDMFVTKDWMALPPADEDVIIYAMDGPLSFTSHTSPLGKTVGITLDRRECHIIKAGTALMVRSATRSDVTLVRSTA